MTWSDQLHANLAVTAPLVSDFFLSSFFVLAFQRVIWRPGLIPSANRGEWNRHNEQICSEARWPSRYWIRSPYPSIAGTATAQSRLGSQSDRHVLSLSLSRESLLSYSCCQLNEWQSRMHLITPPSPLPVTQTIHMQYCNQNTRQIPADITPRADKGRSVFQA